MGLTWATSRRVQEARCLNVCPMAGGLAGYLDEREQVSAEESEPGDSRAEAQEGRAVRGDARVL